MCEVGSVDWAVRAATAADADAMGALHVRSWRYGYRGLVPDEVLAALNPAQRAQRWRETLALPGDSAVFLGCGPAPVAHRAGVDYLRAAGFRHLVLWVLRNNDRARAFYSRHGWRSDEVVDQYRFQGAEMTVLRYSRELR